MTSKTLKSAALSGDISATKYFLENGINPSQKVSSGTLLQFVIRYNFTDIAILLMKYGAEVNTQDKFGDTPLHEATQNRQASRYAHEKFWPSCPQNLFASRDLY